MDSVRPMTRWEKEFFQKVEKFNLLTEFYEDGSIVHLMDDDYFHKLSSGLFSLVDRLKGEIIENITLLQSKDREYYINRLKDRLSKSVTWWSEFANEPFGMHFTKNNTNKTTTIEPDIVLRYGNIVFGYCNELIEFIENSVCNFTKSKRIPLSYHWQGEPGELSELYQKMKDRKLIAADTDVDYFKAIFEAKPLNKILPIKWLQRPVLLASFIDGLNKSGKIDDKDSHWLIAEHCFKYFSKKANAFIFPNKLAAHKTNKIYPANHQLIKDLY